MNDGKAIKPKLAGFALALIVPVSLLGCAQVPPRVALDRSSGQEVKKVALLQIIGPVHVQVRSSGGRITELERSKEIHMLFFERKVTLASTLAEALQESLTQAGFEVKYLQGVLPGYSPEAKPSDYSLVPSYWQEADSILEVRLSVAGFLSPGNSGDYHPWVGATARLLDAKTKETRYFQILCYGCTGSSKEIEYLAVDPKFIYPRYGMLKNRFDHAAQGLRAGASEIGARIAGQLGGK